MPFWIGRGRGGKFRLETFGLAIDSPGIARALGSHTRQEKHRKGRGVSTRLAACAALAKKSKNKLEKELSVNGAALT